MAVGQTITLTATPLKSVHAFRGVPVWEEITAVLETWQPDFLVVGMPYSSDGSKKEMAHLTEVFIKELEGRYGLVVRTVDERFTTQDAKRSLFEQGGYRALVKSDIDGWAAKIIVESGLKCFS